VFDGGGGVVAGAVLAGFLDLVVVVPGALYGARAGALAPHFEVLRAGDASPITKYTMTCGGSFPPFRLAVFPVASSTASRGTQDTSTPRRPGTESGL
jgi:hypothetical protein